MPTTTGPDLRVERRAAEVTTVDLASRMGVSRQTLWALERSAIVTADRAQQYRAALADAIETSKERIA